MWIAILGMHRSGTSALAGVLESLGYHFGDSDAALPATPHNPKGYLERQDVMAINDSILSHLGCGWDQLARFDARLVEEFQYPALADPIRKVLSQLEQNGIGFIKDPRLCLTLPVWERYSPPAAIVWVLRHPIEVAQSLAARGDCSIQVGLALWEIYNRTALRWLHQRPIIRVDFEVFRNDPVAGTHRLADALTQAGLPPIHPVQAEVVLKWFKRELVNNTVTAATVAQVPAALQSFYEQLKSLQTLPAPTPPTLETIAHLAAHQDEVRPLKALLKESNHTCAKQAWALRVQNDRRERLRTALLAFEQSVFWRILHRLHLTWMRCTGQAKRPTPMDKIRAILAEKDDV